MADNNQDNINPELSDDALEAVSGGLDNTTPFKFKCNTCGYLLFMVDDNRYYMNPNGTLVKGFANLDLTGFYCPVCPIGRLQRFEGFEEQQN